MDNEQDLPEKGYTDQINQLQNINRSCLIMNYRKINALNQFITFVYEGMPVIGQCKSSNKQGE